MITLRIKKAVIPIAGITVCLYFMFRMPSSVAEGVINGLKICFYTVLPSLFPFMVLSSYIVKSDVLSPIYRIISPVTKFIFRQPACTSAVIIMSLIGGFPVGAKMTSELLYNGRITCNQAQRLNMFCINCGPAFAVTAVGAGMYRSNRAGWIIYLSLTLSCIILGIASSFFSDGESEIICTRSYAQSPLSALSASVSDTVQSVLGMCAWIVLFSALTSCIKTTGINGTLYYALSCVSEVTGGCRIASEHFSIPVTAAVIGFGGICVHCQVFSYISSSGLKYIRFLVGRAINAALSALICYALLIIFPVDTAVSITETNITAAPFSVSIPAFFALTAMCIIMIFDIDNKKKTW